MGWEYRRPRAPAQAPPPQAVAPNNAATGCDRLEEESSPTEETKHLQTTIRLLTAVGVFPGVAHRLARQPWVTPDLVQAWARHLGADPRVRKVGAVLASILRQPETCTPAPDGGTDPSCQDRDRLPEADAALPVHDAQEAAAPCGPMVTEWNRVLDHLRERMGSRRVKVWLGQSAPISCEDGVLVVGVGSPGAASWIENRLYAQVQQAVEVVTGQALELRFVVGRGTLG